MYNPNIHHRKSIRLKNYNYSQEGLYFVTICTKNREHLFGDIKNGEMILNEYGKIVEGIWNEFKNHFPNIELFEFIIMPNHIHGIIQIVDNDNCGGVICGDAICRGAICGDAICRDAICGDAICRGAINRTPTVNDDEYHPMLLNGGFSGKYNPMFYNNIGRMVRWFKGRISFECRKINPGFKWQGNYWEHIIRNEKSYYRIAEYIINNPKKWEFDTLKN